MRVTSSSSIVVLSITSFLFATGFLGDDLTYYLQSIPDSSPTREIYSYGIIAIQKSGIEIYLKPANDIWLKSTTKLLGIVPIPFGTTKYEEPYPFTNWMYYPEARERKRRPKVFMVEVMFITSEAGLSFDPYDNAVILGDQRAGLVKYAVIDTSQRSNTRRQHSRPSKRRMTIFCGPDVVQLPNNRDLLPGESPYYSACGEHAQIILSPSKEQREFILPTTLGFILTFDLPTPIPGVDNFTIQLHGLRADGIPVLQQDILFDRSQQIKVRHH